MFYVTRAELASAHRLVDDRPTQCPRKSDSLGGVSSSLVTLEGPCMASSRTSPVPKPRTPRFTLAGIATLAAILVVMFVLDRAGIVQVNWGKFDQLLTSAPEDPADDDASADSSIDKQPEAAHDIAPETTTQKRPNVRTIEKSKPLEKPAPTPPPSTERDSQLTTLIEDVTITDQSGRVVFRGDVDLSETLERIDRGEELPQYRNDGIVFQNRERRLPSKRRGHYREWVHPTPQLGGPGPQRIVSGEDGERYYTADHYETFQRLDRAD